MFLSNTRLNIKQELNTPMFYFTFFYQKVIFRFGVIESVNSNVHPGPQRKDAFVLQNKQVADAGQTPSNSGGQSFSQNTWRDPLILNYCTTLILLFLVFLDLVNSLFSQLFLLCFCKHKNYVKLLNSRFYPFMIHGTSTETSTRF